MKRATLTKEEQRYWLDQHVRTRVYAVIASRQKIRDLQAMHPQGSDLWYHLEFIFHGTWEGQHAAMRWLLEFIGVRNRESRQMVSILCFDEGKQVAPENERLPELKEIWLACSKVTSHPTIGKHPDISELRMFGAAQFIVSHLREVYAKAGVAPLPGLEILDTRTLTRH